MILLLKCFLESPMTSCQWMCIVVNNFQNLSTTLKADLLDEEYNWSKLIHCDFPVLLHPKRRLSPVLAGSVPEIPSSGKIPVPSSTGAGPSTDSTHEKITIIHYILTSNLSYRVWCYQPDRLAVNILDKGRISALEESEWVLITMGVRMIINKRIFFLY